MRGKRERNRTGNRGQGDIKSPQSEKPETVTQFRANFREIKGGGGKKIRKQRKKIKIRRNPHKIRTITPETPRSSGQPAPGAAGTR